MTKAKWLVECYFVGGVYISQTVSFSKVRKYAKEYPTSKKGADIITKYLYPIALQEVERQNLEVDKIKIKRL